VYVPVKLPKGARFTTIVTALTKIGYQFAEHERARSAAARKAAAEAGRVFAEVVAEAPVARENGHAVAPVTLPTVEWRDGDPRTEIIEFTPAFARDLLAANRFFDEGVSHAGRCNRKYRPAVAERYAKAMLRGEWVITGETIGQDVDGELTNGQHRLMGVVIAGETDPEIVVPLQITYDLPREARNVTDSGLRRTLADNLAMNGEKDSNILGAVCRLIYLYDNVPYTNRSWGKNATLSYEQTMAMLDQEPEIREAVRRGHNVSVTSKVLASAAGAAYHLINREYPTELVDDFFDRLQYGAPLEPKHPILALRNQMTQQLVRRTQRSGPHHLALTIKAWNLTIEGRERAFIRWDIDEIFPIVRPASLPYKMTRELRSGQSPTG
jgi:hypothetical protein